MMTTRIREQIQRVESLNRLMSPPIEERSSPNRRISSSRERIKPFNQWLPFNSEKKTYTFRRALEPPVRSAIKIEAN